MKNVTVIIANEHSLMTAAESSMSAKYLLAN